MNSLKFWLRNRLVHFPNKRIAAISSGLLPCWLWAVWLSSNTVAYDWSKWAMVKGALVTQSKGMYYKASNNSPLGTSAQDKTLKNYSESLFVPKGKQGNLTGISQSGSPIGPDAYILPINSDTEYRYPCMAVGYEGLIGWAPTGNGSTPGCVKPGFRLKPRRGQRRTQSPGPKNTWTARANKNVLKAQSPFEPLLNQVQFQYCSTVEDSGKRWKVGFSDRVGFLGSGDPCKKALEDCLKASSGSECSVARLGEWKATDRDLTVSVDCGGNNVIGQGKVLAAAVTALFPVLKAEALSATSCVLDIYPPGEVIVSPTTDQLTLIQVREDEGQLRIDAIAGDVIVKSAEQPRGERLREGFTYYTGGYDGDQYFPRQPEQTNRAQVSNSPIIQSFLNTDDQPSTPFDTSIPQDVLAQIAAQRKEYQEALRQYLNSSPSIPSPPPQ